MIDPKTQVVTPEDILSEFHCELLSQNAKQLYVAAWTAMQNAQSTFITLDDAKMSIRSKISLKNLGKAQSEIASANLLAMVPGANWTRYEFVSDPDDPEAEAL